LLSSTLAILLKTDRKIAMKYLALIRRKLVLHFINSVNGWNKEFHDATEARVMLEYKKTYPNGTGEPEKIINDMRTFYYMRIAATANILLAGMAVLVSFVALAVSFIALYQTYYPT